VVALAHHVGLSSKRKAGAMDRPRIVWRRPAARAARRLAELAAVQLEPADATAADLQRARLAAALLAVGIPTVEDAPNPKAEAIGLLKLAAEVEHALLVQYLYAAGSVGGVAKAAITDVAVQEMGHLLTVQNLLLAISGLTAESLRAEVHFGRDGLRRTSGQNPLPFVLEEVSRNALAKFVVVERPHRIPDPVLEARVTQLEADIAALGVHPNPVFALYAAIRWLFQADDTPDPSGLGADLGFRAGWHIGDGDFVPPEIVERVAADGEEWGGFGGVIIRPVHDRAEALSALDEIASQGEGLPGGGADSHFAAFVALLDQFEAGSISVTPLPRTPFAPDQPTPEDDQPTPITQSYTMLWARLFNVSYELLLVDLAWAISSPVGSEQRQALIDLCLAGMRRAVGQLATYLATRRRLNDTDLRNAGPPFGLVDESTPETVAAFRVRYDTLLARSGDVTAAIRAHPEFQGDTAGGQRLNTIAQITADREPLLPRSQMSYAIYPPIGFARLGNSPDAFFIGPEALGALGVEIDGAGVEQPVTGFKDPQFRMKRQGARFRIFEVADGADPVEAIFPPGTVVRWTVTMANKKDAIVRPDSPPHAPIAVQADPARADRQITATATAAGRLAAPADLMGSYRGTDVKLGDIRTDAGQRLIVLGGSGRAASLSNPPAPMGGSFYNNPDWFDDIGDGPVTAVIEVPGQPPQTATGAWVVVGPPDFSPPSSGVVTLYDVVREVAIGEGWLTAPAQPFFETDIRPMVERAAKLRYVDDSSAWPAISQDWAQLSNVGGSQALRAETADLVREVENALHDFVLRGWQNAALTAWVAGAFQPGAAPDRGLCDVLTRSALDGTLGQGFFPGIEAGINMTDSDVYASAAFEYRFADGALQPGDVTALMAQPWQADFLKCNSGWWPAQRPFRATQANGSRRPWLRPTMDHVQLVAGVMKLGVVTPDAAGAAVERDRDPTLGP